MSQSQVSDARIVCSACGKKYKWQEKLAGKKVKCGCGAVIAVPAAATAVAVDEPEDLYALAADAERKRSEAEARSAVVAPVVAITSSQFGPGLRSQ